MSDYKCYIATVRTKDRTTEKVWPHVLTQHDRDMLEAFTQFMSHFDNDDGGKPVLEMLMTEVEMPCA